MSQPLMSFVIPTFNRSALIERAIDSILSGEKLDADAFEIIVVDDGSTDDTAMRIQRFTSDARFKYLAQPQNKGVAAVRNVGIKRARGRWIVLLDSDNYVVSGGMALLYKSLLALPEEVGIFWANCVTPNGQKTVLHNHSGIVPGIGVVLGAYAGEHFSAVRTLLAKTHPFAELGTRNECAACFWYPISLETKVYLSQEVLQYYETHGDDRVTSLKTRLTRAPELEICFRETLSRFGKVLLSRAPEQYWALKGKVAFYASISGNWLGAICSALLSLRGAHKAPVNILIFFIVLAGPRFTRYALRKQST